MFRRMVIVAVQVRLKFSIWVIALQLCFWMQEVARQAVHGVRPTWEPLKSHRFPVCIAKGFQASGDGRTRGLLEVITQCEVEGPLTQPITPPIPAISKICFFFVTSPLLVAVAPRYIGGRLCFSFPSPSWREEVVPVAHRDP